MDADGSHAPRDLARLLAAVQGGDADLALGSRYVPGGRVTDWSLVRRATSRGGSWYARVVLGLDVRDLTGGFQWFAGPGVGAIDLPRGRSPRRALPVALASRPPGPGLLRGAG